MIQKYLSISRLEWNFFDIFWVSFNNTKKICSFYFNELIFLSLSRVSCNSACRIYKFCKFRYFSKICKIFCFLKALILHVKFCNNFLSFNKPMTSFNKWLLKKNSGWLTSWSSNMLRVTSHRRGLLYNLTPHAALLLKSLMKGKKRKNEYYFYVFFKVWWQIYLF